MREHFSGQMRVLIADPPAFTPFYDHELAAALAAAGADVVVAGEETVAMDLALAALDERGLRRVDCEGGPHVLGALIDADLVDVLCVTFSPLLAGGDAGRIAVGPLPPAPRSMELESVLHHDSALLLRYRKVTPDPVTPGTSAP